VVALTLFLITGAVNLQAPLYTTYARASHLGAGAQTLAFACYVGGLLPTLIFLGGLSDRVGRKLPLSTALLLTIAATSLPMIWPRLEAVAAARALCGIATGLMAGSGTQFLVELIGSRPAATARAARIVAAATSLGFGCGALATGLSLLAVPSQQTPVSYGGYIICAACGLVLLARIHEPSFPRSSAWLRMPVFASETLTYSVAILIAWSAVGMVIGLVPVVLSSHGHDAWTGFSTFFVISTGLVAQPLARKLSPLRSLCLGMLLAPCGFTVLIVGVAFMSLPLLLIGAMLASAASYGFTYLAGLAANSTYSTDADRARATSGYFLFAYFGFSVPVIASGAMADRVGVNSALRIFDGGIILATILLALLMILQVWRKAPSSSYGTAHPKH
jgi:MFS family permease